MSNRHLARAIIMQILYQWDFRGRPTATLPAIAEQQVAEFGGGLEANTEYIRETVDGVVDHVTDIDGIIAAYAPAWPIDQMSVVDRNILRIGAYELKWNSAIPPKVAINEAIEIAKSYGGPSSGKFVNGVLGAMYHDMVEKGEILEEKNETPAATDA